MAELEKSPDDSENLLPDDADELLFGIDWNACMEEAFSTARAARESMQAIASNPELTAYERHQRQSQALELHSEAMAQGFMAAYAVLAARDRATYLFTGKIVN